VIFARILAWLNHKFYERLDRAEAAEQARWREQLKAREDKQE
jgi:hypothetical protein